MKRLAETKNEIRVVSDQVGSPTYAPDLAALLCDIIFSKKFGIFHATNEGFCSWAQFAEEIMRLINNKCKIIPISSEEFCAKATRPKNSRLSKDSLDAAGFARLPDWRDALIRFFQ
jgi:dTDP-4-dehydrorhamnose reductase